MTMAKKGCVGVLVDITLHDLRMSACAGPETRPGELAGCRSAWTLLSVWSEADKQFRRRESQMSSLVRV